MKTRLPVLAFAAAVTLAAPVALAGHGKSDGPYYDYARVVDVDPVVRTVRVSSPREECWDETVPVYYDEDYQSATPMILGGIIGGVVGNQFGGGHGKDVLTVAGTILGGSIGRDIARQNRYRRAYDSRVETRCRTVEEYHEEERIDGYLVTYRYNGREYTTSMKHEPGRRIRVRVRVEPAE